MTERSHTPKECWHHAAFDSALLSVIEYMGLERARFERDIRDLKQDLDRMTKDRNKLRDERASARD